MMLKKRNSNWRCCQSLHKRGSCLAGVNISTNILPGVIQLATGAWFDPLHGDDGSLLCRHGNPHVLTRDEGTSKRRPTAFTLVEVEKYASTFRR